MNFLPKSRFIQISVVSGSLLFALWLSTTMWSNTFHQRVLVKEFQLSNEKEALLFDLAYALSKERRLAYTLFNGTDIGSSAVERAQELSNTTTLLATEHENSFAQIDSEILHNQSDGHGHAHMEAESSEHSAMETENTEHSELSGSAVKRILQTLRDKVDPMYDELKLNRVSRRSAYGMYIFHAYTDAIDSIDHIRHSLHTTPGNSIPEYFIIANLKDSFWIFRESVSQITALLEGISTMYTDSQDLSQSTHQANMLMELKVRVDISWEELMTVIGSSSNPELVDRARGINDWYNQNFKLKSVELSEVSQANTVSIDSLDKWLLSARQLSAVAEDIRLQTSEAATGLINEADHRTTISLLKASILVIASLLLALVSALFFRRIDKQAHQDELTGLDNRRMFSMSLSKCLARTDTEAGIIMIDLDKFKQINDTMGHAAGDLLLQDVSQRIVKAGQGSISISRLGGDEFAMLFQGEKTNSLGQIASTIRKTLIDPFEINGATLGIGSSIGIAYFPRDAQSPDSLLKAADLAMYCAKKSGTNQIALYDSQIDQSMAMQARTVTELHSALENDEFELYYQPQFNLAEAKVISAEALIRWNHPERGLLTPYHFISIAEENGLMPTIGNWVIKEACRQAAVWLYENKTPLRIAVNISSDHFFLPNFVQTIIDCLEMYKLPPQLLEVEVTESVAMSDIGLVVESLQKLRELSVHVALDDFGTGYSSLSYLQELPLDTLKIDKSFIQNMLQGNAQKETITETIVALGKNLNLETVAEGVETADQLSAVSDMRISVVQGYYYSKPVCAKEMISVVEQLNNMNPNQKAA